MSCKLYPLKIIYKTRAEAVAALDQHRVTSRCPKLDVYLCPNADHYHLGNDGAPQPETRLAAEHRAVRHQRQTVSRPFRTSGKR